MAVAATNVSIQLLNRSNIESFGYSLDTLDNNINVGPIIYGQSKDIVIKVDNNSKNAPIEAKLTYKNMANGKVLSQSFLSSTSIEFNQISDHIERLMVSSTLQETIRSIHDKLKNDIGYNKTHNNIIQTELQNKYEELSAYITYLKSFPTKTEYISNLILDLEGQVIFLKNITHDLKNALVAQSNVFVMPSIIYKKSVEGFGIAYVEAAQYGIPSIGGKDGGASDAIKDKETGIICDGNDLEEIYSSIDLILKNNSYKELGKKAKEYATKFEWDNIIKEYLKILWYN